LTHKDLKGEGIERIKNYYIKILKIEAVFTTPNWKFIQTINKIRNVIAHNLSNIEEHNNKKCIEQFRKENTNLFKILNYRGIDQKEQRLIIFSEIFCYTVIETICNFNLDLYNAIEPTSSEI